jgi:uncharacterized protein (DUF952 family)
MWQDAVSAGVYKGAPVDLSDGFIHFSTREQVEETARKHFQNKGDLLLIAFNSADFGDAMKWEISRGGDQFPHLYSELDPALAIAAHTLTQNEDGSHTFPDHY